MPVIGTNNIWPNYSAGNTSAAKKNGDTTLGQDDFMKILVAQLRHQDPMQPMQDRDFIAQMAQFSNVEQTMKMANELQMLRQSLGISADLIGKYVSWFDMNESGTGIVTKSGTVEAITFNDGKQFVIVDGFMISIDEITMIAQSEDTITNSDPDQEAQDPGEQEQGEED